MYIYNDEFACQYSYFSRSGYMSIEFLNKNAVNWVRRIINNVIDRTIFDGKVKPKVNLRPLRLICHEYGYKVKYCGTTFINYQTHRQICYLCY